mgnify:CR=1 FL=1
MRARWWLGRPGPPPQSVGPPPRARAATPGSGTPVGGRSVLCARVLAQQASIAGVHGNTGAVECAPVRQSRAQMAAHLVVHGLLQVRSVLQHLDRHGPALPAACQGHKAERHRRKRGRIRAARTHEAGARSCVHVYRFCLLATWSLRHIGTPPPPPTHHNSSATYRHTRARRSRCPGAPAGLQSGGHNRPKWGGGQRTCTWFQDRTGTWLQDRTGHCLHTVQLHPASQAPPI